MNPLKRLASQTAVYGLSSVIGRFLNYLLVPLYTYTFAPADNGVVAEFYAYMGFLAVLLVSDVFIHMRVLPSVPAFTPSETSETFKSQLNWVRQRAGHYRVWVLPHGFGYYNPNVGTEFEFSNINSFETFTLTRWRNYVDFMAKSGVRKSNEGSSTFNGVLLRNHLISFLNNADMIGLAVQAFCYAGDIPQIGLGGVRSQSGIGGPLPGVNEIGSGDGTAVMESRVLIQVKSINKTILTDLPTIGQIWLHLQILVQADQAAKYVAQRPSRPTVSQGRVHGLWLPGGENDGCLPIDALGGQAGIAGAQLTGSE